ncbi:MAG: 6-bladed beta-propeller [Phycisphaeraceae bacterium]|nr:MAG: 6-bladed beta-propeller [Phycisphaeraceae bacterium]
MLVALVALLGAGCSSPPAVRFESTRDELRWPAPPDPARIQYAGSLVSAADPRTGLAPGDGVFDALLGKKESAGMVNPMAVCTDGPRLMVADSGIPGVHVFNTKNGHYEFWTPPAKAAQFSAPISLARTPDGRLLVSDSAEGCLFVFDAAGKYLGTIGDGLLQRPVGVCVDARNGRILVADAGAHLVFVFAPDGEEITRIGGRGIAPGQFNYPTYTAVDAQGRLYVADSLNFRVQVFTENLEYLMSIGSKGDMPGYFAQPKGLAVDDAGRLYVADANFEAIQIFDPEGRLLMAFGREGRAPGEFWLPTGVYIDEKGSIWIADSYNRRVQKFEYIGPDNGDAGKTGTGAGS